MAVLGYEIAHNIHAQKPKLYAQRETAVFALSPIPEGYSELEESAGIQNRRYGKSGVDKRRFRPPFR